MTSLVAPQLRAAGRARVSGEAPDRQASVSAGFSVIGRAFGIARSGGCGHVHAEKRTARKTKVEAYIERHESARAKTVKAALDRARKKLVPSITEGYARHVEPLRQHKKLAKDISPAEQKAIEDLMAQIDADQVGVVVREALGPELADAFRDAGLVGVAEVGFDAGPDITGHLDIAASEYAASRGAELVTQISGSTRDELRDLITQAVEDGWSSQTLGGAIEESQAFSEARSTMIARTELAFAHVQGNLAGWKATDQVSAKRWLASQDACPICEDMDGEEVELDGAFDFDGEKIDGPPGHPHCRCDVLPVLKPEGGE